MRALFRTYLLSSSLSAHNLLRTTLSVDEPPLRVYRYLSRSIPHFQWKGRISPFRIDGGEALGFIFWHILIPFSREMRTIFIQKFTYVRYTASAFPIQGRVNLNLELLVETREEETYMCT